jgi:hypothetical protein
MYFNREIAENNHSLPRLFYLKLRHAILIYIYVLTFIEAGYFIIFPIV